MNESCCDRRLIVSFEIGWTFETAFVSVFHLNSFEQFLVVKIENQTQFMGSNGSSSQARKCHVKRIRDAQIGGAIHRHIDAQGRDE